MCLHAKLRRLPIAGVRTNTCCRSSKSRILILRLGELLFADDALWNSAFEDFARKVGTPEARILHGVGVLPEKWDVKLLLYSHYFAPSIGGVETIVMSLARGLADLRAGKWRAGI